MVFLISLSTSTDTQEQKDNLNNDSAAWLEYRKGIEFEVSSRYKFVSCHFGATP